ncbi:hypothetical protein A3746_28630 [Oleibacter sp. HI0075]|nr:hypothetical protein A3746_06365 [Oleibacter sp. HI0075]KZZ09582.1 hypothetical protein A3746_28630 [Oleibacter sp. HI0075]
MKKLLVASLCSIGLSACSSDPDFDVNVTQQPNPLFGNLNEVIEITATGEEDSTVLHDIKINRGGCPHAKSFPLTLRFGTPTRIYVNSATCDVRELEITSDEGTFLFEYEGY